MLKVGVFGHPDIPNWCANATKIWSSFCGKGHESNSNVFGSCDASNIRNDKHYVRSWKIEENVNPPPQTEKNATQIILDRHNM